MTRLKFGDHIIIETETYDQATELLDRIERNVLPVLYDPPGPEWNQWRGKATPKNAVPAPGATVRKIGGSAAPSGEERELARRYKEKFGKGFWHNKASGKTRLEALKEALRDE